MMTSRAGVLIEARGVAGDYAPAPRAAVAGAARWMRRLALAGVLFGFAVVVLGAYVRASDAGLGCPDWPGCYGHFAPQANSGTGAAPTAAIDLGKAWREMAHRYAASTLGLIIVLIVAIALGPWRGVPGASGYALALLATVIVQGILGMLTVTWKLQPLIVTLHLLTGLTTLGLLWWLWLRLQAREEPPGPLGTIVQRSWLRPLLWAALAMLALQILLGGWTSSHYAAVACPDFPRCQGRWWPAMQYSGAFEIWRRGALNYEGGVLELAARTAIHMLHRFGAVLATLLLSAAALAVIATRTLRFARRRALMVLVALAAQLGIGISMVLNGFPLALASAHTAGAALLLLATLNLAAALL